MQLEHLFDSLGSDKGSRHEAHKYSQAYEWMVPRDTKNLLEIGIGANGMFNAQCGSIRAWLQWLISGHVYGFDILEAPEALKVDPRFTFMRGDQGDRMSLEKLRAAIPEMDIIIDDGSHVSQHQLLTFEILWPKLKPGGFYVIEDIHCPLGPPPTAFNTLKVHPNFVTTFGSHGEAMALRK